MLEQTSWKRIDESIEITNLEIYEKIIENTKWRSLYLLLEDNSNIDTMINNNVNIISNIWEEFCTQNNLNFDKPSINFFKWDINLNKKYEGYIFYYSPDNSIYINRYNLIDIVSIVWFSSWLLTVIAHEIWHSIQNSNLVELWRYDKEQHADFLAWFTIRKLVELWKVNEGIIDDAVESFENLWIACDTNFIKNWVINSHWNGLDRKSAVEMWYNSSDSEVVDSILQIKK